MKHQRTLVLALALMTSTVWAAGPAKKTPALIEKGKKSYAINCLTCHGDKGDGNGPAGAMLNPKPRNFSTDPFKQGDKPEQVFGAISKGLPGTAMVGFGHLAEEERWGLVYYVLSFKEKGAKKK